MKKIWLLSILSLICIINISLGEDHIIFTKNLTVIEEKLIKSGTINTHLNFKMINSLFIKSCKPETLRQTNQNFQILEKHWKENLTNKEYLSFLEKKFETVKSLILKSTNHNLENICEEKYPLYQLLASIQKNYFKIKAGK